MFPVENRYSRILLGEGYIGIRALADFFCLRLKYSTIGRDLCTETAGCKEQMLQSGSG